MADRRDDARGKKIVFVSSCLLNTNNKVKGLARYSGMCGRCSTPSATMALASSRWTARKRCTWASSAGGTPRTSMTAGVSGIIAGNWRSVPSPTWRSTPGRATRWWLFSAATAPLPAA